jgi:hypothetical protein
VALEGAGLTSGLVVLAWFDLPLCFSLFAMEPSRPVLLAIRRPVAVALEPELDWLEVDDALRCGLPSPSVLPANTLASLALMASLRFTASSSGNPRVVAGSGNGNGEANKAGKGSPVRWEGTEEERRGCFVWMVVLVGAW